MRQRCQLAVALYKLGTCVKPSYIFAATLLLLVAAPAHAYIDPGSGSAIMSAIIGFFVAIGLAVKTYWYKLKGLFKSSDKAPAPPETPSQNDE